MPAVQYKRLGDPLAKGFTLKNWPFYHMNMAVRSYDTEMKRLLKSAQLDVARWRILMIAHEHEPVSVGEVAELTIMDPSTAMRAMQRLQRDALIEIATRKTDQRVSEATLTDEGRVAMQLVLKAASRVYHQAFASFDAEDIKALNGLLSRVNRALREPMTADTV